MAYDSSNEVRKELGRIQKNDRGDYIVVTQIDNEKTGNCNIDIRAYYTADDGDIRPTQKGVRFNAEMLEEFIQALENGLE